MLTTVSISRTPTLVFGLALIGLGEIFKWGGLTV